MDTPTVEQIVRQWLEANGYDGLVWLSPGEACGCSFRDGAGLFPCGEPASECQAAYKWEDGLMYTEQQTVIRAPLERLQAVINEECECGGAGPDDPEACAACRVWHRMKKNHTE